MAKFELELSIREKRQLMAVLSALRSEYKESLRAAEHDEVAFESDEQKKRLVKRTACAVDILNLVLGQLHEQSPR